MRNAVIGGLVTVALLLGAGWLYLKLGLYPTNADATPGSVEKYLANMARDAAVARAAGKEPNPFPQNDENLSRGLKVYVNNCQGCHGGTDASSKFGAAMYPSAPQFHRRSPHDPDAEMFYVVKHGIRLTGMPAFGAAGDPLIKDEDIWLSVLFLKAASSLPPAVEKEWKALEEPPKQQ